LNQNNKFEIKKELADRLLILNYAFLMSFCNAWMKKNLLRCECLFYPFFLIARMGAHQNDALFK